jgi:hypothetical protein
MNYPGNNELHLNEATVTSLLESHLNQQRASDLPRIRVTNVKLSGGYSSELVARITTDLPAAGDAE